jgi:hypothetical protein
MDQQARRDSSEDLGMTVGYWIIFLKPKKIEPTYKKYDQTSRHALAGFSCYAL